MKMLAIDGNSIMNRAFYGIKALSNKNGVFTNAVTGFMNIYLKAVNDINPDMIVVAFDLREPTFRHKEVATYKANRHGMPDELAMQMPIIKELLTDLGVKVCELTGFEADDVLGTLSKMCGDNGDHCYVLTGDKDSLQLINDNCTVLLHTTKELINYTTDKFIENYGFEPIHLIDLKALMGDSSDNIKGVKGIGEKTAMALISEHKTIENLYASLESDSLTATKSILEKLRVGKEDAEQSKWLATIILDAPIDNNLQNYMISECKEDELSSLLTGLEMYKLLERLKLKPSANPKVISSNNDTVEQAEKPMAEDIDYEIADLTNDVFDEIISTNSNVSFIYTNSIIRIVYNNKIYTIFDKNKQLKFLSSPSPKYTFEAKPVYHFCMENNMELKNIKADADILGYLLNTSSSDYTVSKMCIEYNSKYYDNMGEYADICSLPQLCDVMLCEVERMGMNDLLYQIELPLTEVLASMEHYGVTIDTNGIKDFGVKLTEEIGATEQQIYFMAGHEFNIASPKQLGVVLFDEMGLPALKKTKTGYSTNAEVLDGLRDKHEIIDLILHFRQLSKLNSTYVEGLLKVVSDDGRVRSVFKQTETKTGRISSTEPNMQNIPIRTELGREMRKFFTASEGYTLLDADYSQIELRILAHMSGDKNMQDNFLSGMDIHTSTAAQVFDMPLNMVTPEMRRAAKAVNFGIVYGIGAFSLSKDINVTVKQADQYIKNYLDNYPNVKQFMDNVTEDAIKTGYAVTMFNRRRYIPELKASNKNIQSFGKRAAMNAPIQGTAADIIKIAMVKVYKRLKEEKLDARLILQVHDELIIEVSPKDKDKAMQILGEEMINAARMDIPLIADVECGFTWYDAKG